MKYKELLSLKNLSSLNLRENDKVILKDFVRQFELNKNKLKKIEGYLFGQFQSVKNGVGFDFNEIREYIIGDDLRHICWSATAKLGKLQTKEYFSEKDVRSYFLVDISSSMFTGNKFDLFVQTIAFMLNFTTGFSEKIGGLFFSAEILYNFPPGEAHTQANIMFQSFIDYINNLKDKTPSSPTSTNMHKALEFTNKYFNKKGIVFIISDFLNLINWQKILFQTSQLQNIYLFQIYDHLDFYLPKSGYINLIDPETKQNIVVNTDSKKLQDSYYEHMTQKQENIKKFIKSIDVSHIVIEKNDFNLTVRRNH